MKNHKIGGRVAAVVVFTLAATTMVGISAAAAVTDTLTNTRWSVSNSQTGAKNVSYTYEFTTSTKTTISSVTAKIPLGAMATAIDGTVGVGPSYGLSTAATVTLMGNTLTYKVATPAEVGPNTPIYIEFTGLTNSPMAGDYTSTVTTFDNSTVPVEIESTKSQLVTFGAASATVTVAIPKSLTFENDTTAFDLKLDPAISALQAVSKVVVLKVRTNAGQGYTLTAANDGLKAKSGTKTYTIPNASTTATTKAAQAFNTFAFTAVGTTLSSKSTIGTLFSAADSYVGHGATAATTSLLTASGPTGDAADVLTITNQVKINFATPAGTYADTITYVATPTY